MTEVDWLQAIQKRPEDVSLRMVYADWLEERGDLRAEYLRLSAELERLWQLAGKSPHEEKFVRRLTTRILGRAPTQVAGVVGLRARLHQLRARIRPEWLMAADRPALEEDLREAVIRANFSTSVDVYFIQIEGEKDPSWGLLGRFLGHRPPVGAVSAANINADHCEWCVEERGTGRSGCLFTIDSIRWTGPHICKVEGGYYLSPLHGSGGTDQVKLVEGKWVVTDSEMDWIS